MESENRDRFTERPLTGEAKTPDAVRSSLGAVCFSCWVNEVLVTTVAAFLRVIWVVSTQVTGEHGKGDPRAQLENRRTTRAEPQLESLRLLVLPWQVYPVSKIPTSERVRAQTTSLKDLY